MPYVVFLIVKMRVLCLVFVFLIFEEEGCAHMLYIQYVHLLCLVFTSRGARAHTIIIPSDCVFLLPVIVLGHSFTKACCSV